MYKFMTTPYNHWSRRVNNQSRLGQGVKATRSWKGQYNTRPLSSTFRNYRGSSRRNGGLVGSQREQKFLDVDIGTQTTIGATLDVTEPCVIPQGDGQSQRIGRRVFIKSIQLRGTIVLPKVADFDSTSTIVRLLLIQDTQTNGVKFTGSNLLVEDLFDAYNKLSNRNRFKTLLSQDYKLTAKGGAANSTTTYETAEDIVNIHIYKKVDIEIEFDDTVATGAVASVRSNNLYWCWFLSSSVTTPVFTGNSRIRYFD